MASLLKGGGGNSGLETRFLDSRDRDFQITTFTVSPTY